MELISSIYVPIFAQNGDHLYVDRFWESDWVNSVAYRDFGRWGARHIAIYGGMQIPDIVKAQCEARFKDFKRSALCMRIAKTGELFADMDADYHNEPHPSFNKPDPSQVEQTLDLYPSIQCRMDTVLAAALCDRDFHLPVSESYDSVGSCVEGELGARPHCWFKAP